MPKPFVKGDKRINRNGRPKTFDALKAMALAIAHETIENKYGDRTTVTNAILRKWAASSDFLAQRHFIEIAYGKVPDIITGSINGKIEHEITGGIDLKLLTTEELLAYRQLTEKASVEISLAEDDYSLVESLE